MIPSRWRPRGLVVTKLVSFRPQDQEDIRTLLAANRDEIDLDAIRREWAVCLAGSDAAEIFPAKALPGNSATSLAAAPAPPPDSA